MKNVVIIGAGKGIGLEITRLLTKEDTVFALSRTLTEELSTITSNVIEFDSNKDDYSTIENLPDQIDTLVFYNTPNILDNFLSKLRCFHDTFLL
jgi:3-oxoacyl-[acyl-carrier protein] reductase